jgi:hypothetical protein
MSEKLTEAENVVVGSIASFVQATILQPTLYWKNAAQQGLPFTMNPKLVYRGIGASLINEMGQMGLQFGVTGYLKKVFGTGFSGDMAAAMMGGAIVGPFASVCEVTMIQQQLHGGSLAVVPQRILKQHGAAGLLRGVSGTISRDAIYVGGLLGTTPAIQQYMMEERQWNSVAAESFAAVSTGIGVGVVTTPLDAASTSMKGDLERKSYQGFVDTLSKRAAGGLGTFFGGCFWRTVNIAGTIFIANAARVRIEPFFIGDR